MVGEVGEPEQREIEEKIKGFYSLQALPRPATLTLIPKSRSLTISSSQTKAIPESGSSTLQTLRLRPGVAPSCAPRGAEGAVPSGTLGA